MNVDSLPPRPLSLGAVDALDSTERVENAAPQFSLADNSNAVVGLSVLFDDKIVVLGLNPTENAWQRVTEFEFPSRETDPEAQSKAQAEMQNTTDETFEWFVRHYGPHNVAVLDASEFD